MVQAGRAIFTTGGVGVGAKGALETGKARGFTGVFLMESGGAGDAGGGVGGVAVVLFAGAVLANITKLTFNAVRSSATHDAFGTTVLGRPTCWTINATTVSSFLTKVSRIQT